MFKRCWKPRILQQRWHNCLLTNRKQCYFGIREYCFHPASSLKIVKCKGGGVGWGSVGVGEGRRTIFNVRIIMIDLKPSKISTNPLLIQLFNCACCSLMALFIQTENKKRLKNLRNRTPHKLSQTALFCSYIYYFSYARFSYASFTDELTNKFFTY